MFCITHLFASVWLHLLQLTEPGVSGEDKVGRKQTDKPRGEEESKASEDETVSVSTLSSSFVYRHMSRSVSVHFNKH